MIVKFTFQNVERKQNKLTFVKNIEKKIDRFKIRWRASWLKKKTKMKSNDNFQRIIVWSNCIKTKFWFKFSSNYNETTRNAKKLDKILILNTFIDLRQEILMIFEFLNSKSSNQFHLLHDFNKRFFNHKKQNVCVFVTKINLHFHNLIKLSKRNFKCFHNKFNST